MSFSGWTESHKRSLLFLLAVVSLVGGLAAFKLPSSLFPTVDFPRVVVSLEAGDQPAEQMEVLVMCSARCMVVDALWSPTLIDALENRSARRRGACNAR